MVLPQVMPNLPCVGKGQAAPQTRSERSVISWNKRIVGYARGGFNEAALECFKRMQGESISPSSVTFVSILKACATSASLDLGQQIHVEILNSGLLSKDIMVGTALLDMYVKCRRLEDADNVFRQIPERNVVTWTALIAGHACLGSGHTALEYFKQMQDEGNAPNAVTFACVLKACRNIGCLEVGEAIHAEVVNQGLLENDIVLGNTLVDMYVKCGVLGKAEKIFQELPCRNVFSWSILITGYVGDGHHGDALRCLRQMQAEGVFPNAVTFVCVFKACESLGYLEMGEEMHVEVNEDKLLKKDLIVHTSLVDMYGKCGALGRAQKTLELLEERDAVAWTALVAGYALHGRNDEALRLYLQMQDEGVLPNSGTFVCVLKACRFAGLLEKGKHIHVEIRERPVLETDDMVGTALIDMYARCGMLQKAREVFWRLPNRNLVSWSVLIGGYAQHGHGVSALECYRQMRHECVSPDSVAFIHALKACSCAGCLEIGEAMHAEIREVNSFEEGEPLVCNALMDMYVKCGALEKAEEVFDSRFPKHNVVLWNTMLSGLVQYKRNDAALKKFRQMRDEGVCADVVTYICMLKAWMAMGCLSMVKAVHAEVRERGMLEKDLVLGNTLVDVYGKWGLLCSAWRAFEELRNRDVVTWNVLFAGQAQMGKANRAFELFEKMITEESVVPNRATFLILLYACSHAGLVREGCLLFDAVCVAAYPVQFYACMTDLLGRSGHLHEATLLAASMPFPDYHPMLSAVSSGFRINSSAWEEVRLPGMDKAG